MSSSHIPELAGQKLNIPNLVPVFAHWKQGVNPSYERVKAVVNQRLESLISDEKVLRKMKAGDLGLFASWYEGQLVLLQWGAVSRSVC